MARRRCRYKNSDEFYAHMDDACLRMRQSGLEAEAGRIAFLLHSIHWTTQSELLGELEPALRSLLSGSKAAKLPQQLRDELAADLAMLEDLP